MSDQDQDNPVAVYARLRQLRQEAQQARSEMQTSSHTQTIAQATRRYASLFDALLSQLNRLFEMGTEAEIAEFLYLRYGRDG